jgi:hypothetical protein
LLAEQPSSEEVSVGKRFILSGLVAVAGLLGSGCGSGKWVAVPMMGCQDLEDLEKDPENFETAMGDYLGPSTCRDAGGLTYAKDYRCEGD